MDTLPEKHHSEMAQKMTEIFNSKIKLNLFNATICKLLAASGQSSSMYKRFYDKWTMDVDSYDPDGILVAMRSGEDGLIDAFGNLTTEGDISLLVPCLKILNMNDDADTIERLRDIGTWRRGHMNQYNAIVERAKVSCHELAAQMSKSYGMKTNSINGNQSHSERALPYDVWVAEEQRLVLENKEEKI